MRSPVGFFACALLGLVLAVAGWLVPAHLRAVEDGVLARAGGPTLVEQGLALVNQQQLGSAQMLLRAAQSEGVPGREQLGTAVTNLAREHPEFFVWGGGRPIAENLFGNDLKRTNSNPEPFTDFVVRQANREKALAFLGASPQPIVQELVRSRALTNTVLFPPSASASGQAFDAALCIAGLLLASPSTMGNSNLANLWLTQAAQANHAGNPQPLEQTLMDLMSLGQRCNWDQLTVLVGRVEDAETLRRLGGLVRRSGAQLPVLFSAISLSGRPAAVVQYLTTFGQTGYDDLGLGLRFGAGGVNELLNRQQRPYVSEFRHQFSGAAVLGDFYAFAADYCLRMPWFALTLKWVLYLAGGFLLAAAMHFARPAVSALDRPLQVRGFHFARELLFGLGFLLIVLLVSEPFLAEDSQKVETPIRLTLPMAGKAVAVAGPAIKASFMNQKSLLIMALFFVLQGLIYVSCLVKLAEVRRQTAPSRIKLKLLDNEEHLFDAGLYLGFVGTIISLIMVSLGVIKPSLMAAYSSTSFGIIFVSVFKIFHLRPLRRKLLLEAEATPERVPAAVAA